MMVRRNYARKGWKTPGVWQISGNLPCTVLAPRKPHGMGFARLSDACRDSH
jgi:hypothetical protein